LLDSTEARYGEIARKMLSTGNLVTLWFDNGVPFWAKTPLSFWSSAATMSVFGVNEFGARLAPFVFFVATLALFALWPRDEGRDGAPVRLTAALLMATSLLGFVVGGAVMTDMSMTFCTTLCMVSFWRAVQPGHVERYWGWLFFVGIGLGLLAKGPVAVVLTAASIGLWVFRRNRWSLLATRLPWVGGVLLALAIAAPWYVLAERATPGFLRYFIIGEHFQRYLTKGWSGDLYAAGRAKPRGMVWLFALAAFVPWTFVMPWLTGRARRMWRVDADTVLTRDYLVAWALATPIFFTMSRNILLPYVAPCLPAMALLAAPAVVGAMQRAAWKRMVTIASLTISVVAMGVLIISPATLEKSAQREFFRRRPVPPGTAVIYAYERPFSGVFYTRGAATVARDGAAVQAALLRTSPTIVMLRRSRSSAVPAEWLRGWRVADEHGGFIRFERVVVR
jgi:4-amino-4-deoxy-L-arabinose transferase-like glycosyltransferase